MKKRIALLGIYHETNTFSQFPTTYSQFRQRFWKEGEEITNEFRGAHHETSGVIEVFDKNPDYELVPLLFTSATPSGLIDADALEAIISRMFELYDQKGPFDGIIVCPHGAGVAEHQPDMDGYWLKLVREKAGPSIPITGTLDPHANVSPLMIQSTNGLFPYQTNPHIDQKRVGNLAANMMIDILSGGKKFTHTLVQLPLSISIEQQYTSESPCLDILQYAQKVKQENNLYSVSLILGFPYADVEELGSAFIVIAEEGNPNVEKAVRQLKSYMFREMESFNGKKLRIRELIPSFSTMAKPILLLDMGDNVGGGSTAQSTHLLEELDAARETGTFICIYDPPAVERLKKSSTTPESLTIGESSYTITPESFRLIDGKFKELAPRHGGMVNYDMGDSAIVKTKNGQTVMLTSIRTVPFSLNQLLAYDLNPNDFNYIVAKGVNAPIAAYKDVCKHMVKVDTPGDTSADMTRFDFKKRRKPLFPFEQPKESDF